jgi:hypothetical protein
MNISRLRELLKPLPDTFDPVEIDAKLAQELCDECEELVSLVKEARRLADVEELQAALAKVATLQERLGVKYLGPQAPKVAVEGSSKREILPIDETDAGQGVREARDEGTSAQSFQDELAELRARTQAKRRRL